MARKTIVLRGEWWEDSAEVITATLTPGMLVEYTSAGRVRRHSTPGGAAAGLFALANTELDGAGIDTAVAVNASCKIATVQAGALVNAVTSDTIEAGEFVQSAGNGQVEPWTEGSGRAIGVARRASDLSGTVGRVEIIFAPNGL